MSKIIASRAAYNIIWAAAGIGQPKSRIKVTCNRSAWLSVLGTQRIQGSSAYCLTKSIFLLSKGPPIHFRDFSKGVRGFRSSKETSVLGRFGDIRPLSMKAKQSDPDFELDDVASEEEEDEKMELEELEGLDDENADEGSNEDDDSLEEDDVLVVDGGKQRKAWPTKNKSKKVEKKLNKNMVPLVVPDIEDCVFSAEEIDGVRKALLSWYDENHRVLPWRRNPKSKLSEIQVKSYEEQGLRPAPLDLPDNDFIYYVWVCEIMSQQTQISRVCEYFNKWVKKWPTVNDLAIASQDEVNDMWAGLGYYRRARYLLEGAKYVVHDMGGTFPRKAEELQKIPGIGAYTSCAIASTACGEKVAVVDGNVVRVFSRLRKIGGDPKNKDMVKLFAELASHTLDTERPGDFNQSLMELGATVCIPNGRPLCESCPVSSWCRALKAQEQNPSEVSVTDYPSKVEKAQKREERVGVTVLRVLTKENESKFVLVKRPPGGLLAGLWEFPLQHVDANASSKDILSTLDKYLTENLHLDFRKGDGILKLKERKSLGQVVHVFSHIRMTMVVEELCLEGEIPNQLEAADGSDIQWLTLDQLTAKGLSSGVKKVLKLYHDGKKKRKGSITNFFAPLKK